MIIRCEYRKRQGPQAESSEESASKRISHQCLSFLADGSPSKQTADVLQDLYTLG